MAQYKILVYTPSGIKKAEISMESTDSIEISKQRNSVGAAQFVLDANHNAIQYFEDDAQIEIYRKDTQNGINWVCEFYGFFKDENKAEKDINDVLYTAKLVEQNNLLQRRIVAYRADTTDKNSFDNVPAETIMKTVVNQNFGDIATVSNGRVTDGYFSPLSVEADLARGGNQTVRCAWDNVLKILQTVSTNGGGDFGVEKTGTNSWIFKYYAGQLGTDRSSKILFSKGFGNIASPVYDVKRSERKNIIIVGGAGQESERVIAVRSLNLSTTLCNSEDFLNDSSETEEALNSTGDAQLQKSGIVKKLDFEIVQSPNCLYGKHYFLGDIVKVKFFNEVSNFIIDSVNISMSKLVETIKIGTVRVE